MIHEDKSIYLFGPSSWPAAVDLHGRGRQSPANKAMAVERQPTIQCKLRFCHSTPLSQTQALGTSNDVRSIYKALEILVLLLGAIHGHRFDHPLAHEKLPDLHQALHEREP